MVGTIHCAVKVGKMSNACSTNGNSKIAQFCVFCDLRPWKKVLKVEPEVKTKELPPGDPEKSGGTYGKLTTALNIDIHQFVKLEDGLRNTIDYMKNEQSK